MEIERHHVLLRVCTQKETVFPDELEFCEPDVVESACRVDVDESPDEDHSSFGSSLGAQVELKSKCNEKRTRWSGCSRRNDLWTTEEKERTHREK